MIRRRHWRFSVTIAVAAGFALAAPHALAKPKPAKAKVETVKLDLPELKKQLAGSEPEAVAALQTIGDSGNPEGAPLVAEVLTRGATEPILDEALKAAGKLKSPTLSAAIAPYVQHRTDEIRRAAARALVKTKGPVAVATLSKALRSEDASVRGTAATGLGELGAKESLKDLFNALDHGVAEAAASIGQLCAPAECEDFANRTGKLTFDVMQTGFDQILFRPPAEISDDDKLKLVGRMRELGTVEVGKYLADVGERWPKDWSKKVKQAIDSAAHAAAAGDKK
jgi:HEAT repeat protein